MGISGLLPLLKSIQKPTHLSELAGKTIAVDAYVWLHRGAYACATELVTGKPTTKYVDYAMHRVRLLQYHKITPYVVFDGGPLPAKKGTEVERKRKRDENLALANTLARQGKHSHAREHYVKCVDITPQMAFQLIKALRAEQIPYVVAPYEADAQLFHLESIGLVDGILTEDSDLLIFGTQLLLLKLDSSTAMCTAITAGTLASNSAADLPLHGWGVKELRECAMLSGCDYIEGVRGVGLKTASKYLRKWGTVDKALRALRIDGRTIERDWEERMRKAEVGFLNQRVWNPVKCQIVYLTEPDWATWDDQREKFVGGHIDAELASGMARGDIDPITLLPMIDIMPSFQPCVHPTRPRPLAFKDPNRHETMDRDKIIPEKGSLLQYFSKKSGTIPTPQVRSPLRKMQVGRASGKRTLAEQYDHENSAKRLKLAGENEANGVGRCSKFFVSAVAALGSSYPSNLAPLDDDKENLEEVEELDDVDNPLNIPVDLDVDTVEQEEGYMSPPFSSLGCSRVPVKLKRHATWPQVKPSQQNIIPEVQYRPRKNCDRVILGTQDPGSEDEGSLWGDSDGRITSPPTASVRKVKRPSCTISIPKMRGGQVQISESNGQDTGNVVTERQNTLTVDLCDIFPDMSGSSDLGRVAPDPFTPPDDEPLVCALAQQDDGKDELETEARLEERHKVVAAGWGRRFSNTRGRLRRSSPAVERDTTLTATKKAKGKRKEQLATCSTLRRHETITTPFHPGAPRQQITLSAHTTGQTSKPRPSEALPPVTGLTWTPVRPSSSATPQTGGGPEDIEDASDLSSPSARSQDAVVDDAGTTPVRFRIMDIQAYRFRPN